MLVLHESPVDLINNRTVRRAWEGQRVPLLVSHPLMRMILVHQRALAQYGMDRFRFPVLPGILQREIEGQGHCRIIAVLSRGPLA